METMQVYKQVRDLLMDLKRLSQSLINESPEGDEATRRYEAVLKKANDKLKG